MGLPKQLTGDDTEEALQTTYKLVEKTTESLIFGNIVLTLFFALSF